MASAVQRFRDSLRAHRVDAAVVTEIMQGYDRITDGWKKERKAAFFVQAMRVMDQRLDFRTRGDVRGACACSTGGWRERAVRKIARDYQHSTLERRVEALQQVTHMGRPALNDDGTITASIGSEGGFRCPCPVFGGWKHEAPVSPTYCLCCAGHFRHHYQIALGVGLRTTAVLSTALASQGREPCRFVYEVE